MAQNISQIVGKNLRRLRTTADVSQTEFAEAATRHGLDITTSSVLGIENGRSPITLDKAYLLTLVLSELLHRPVMLPDLLESDDPVELYGHDVDPGAWRLLSTGRWAPVLGEGPLHTGPVPLTKTDKRAMDELALLPGEEVVYRRLCTDLWGHLMSQEVAERAEDGDSAQKRGAIARDLLGELDVELNWRLVFAD